MSKKREAVQKRGSFKDLNDEEMQYYLKVMGRVNAHLYSIAAAM